MNKLNLLFSFLYISISIHAQNVCSSGVWIENNGIANIETEHHPAIIEWKTGNALTGFSGSGYIFWDQSQNFNNSSFGRMTYKLKINTPGLYRFDWLVAVGNGTLFTEHNDTWLSITGVDNFFGQKETNATSLVKPKPECNNNATYKCPEGSSTSGYFKIYGGQVSKFQWRAFTFDSDPHEIYFEKKEPGEISINIAARSSFQFIDKIVVYKADQYTRTQARQNPMVEVCSTTVNIHEEVKDVIYVTPNPACDKLLINNIKLNSTYKIFDLSGLLVKEGYLSSDYIDIHHLIPGSYRIEIKNNESSHNLPFLKM